MGPPDSGDGDRPGPAIRGSLPAALPPTTDRMVGAYCEAPGEALERRTIERVFGYFRPGQTVVPRPKPGEETQTASRPLHQRVLKSITGALDAVTPDIGVSKDEGSAGASSATREEPAEDFGQ